MFVCAINECETEIISRKKYSCDFLRHGKLEHETISDKFMTILSRSLVRVCGTWSQVKWCRHCHRRHFSFLDFISGFRSRFGRFCRFFSAKIISTCFACRASHLHSVKQFPSFSYSHSTMLCTSIWRQLSEVDEQTNERNDVRKLFKHKKISTNGYVCECGSMLTERKTEQQFYDDICKQSTTLS